MKWCDQQERMDMEMEILRETLLFFIFKLPSFLSGDSTRFAVLEATIAAQWRRRRPTTLNLQKGRRPQPF